MCGSRRVITIIGLIVTGTGLLAADATLSAAEPVLQLTVGDEAYVGSAVAHNDEVCWLAQPDGRLVEVDVPAVTSFHRLSDDFQRLTLLEARNEMRHQLGPMWTVTGGRHYLVCTVSDRGQLYAELFDELYRSFQRYFTRRGFDLPQPEFPLIAKVYGDRQEFTEQCRRDHVSCTPGLRGYYHRHTNRICLYEDADDLVQNEVPSRPSQLELLQAATPMPRGCSCKQMTSAAFPGRVNANIEASLRDTLVHEATHQLAFNFGLHSRIGDVPRWVIEGLATMFEAEGTRGNTGGTSARERINAERLWWFNDYRQERRHIGALVAFVSNEGAYRKSILDFYAEAWAVTFFLAETRPQAYMEYLETVGRRDPLASYSDADRLRDFQSAFGNDIARLEAEMLRFIDNLQ